ncbi:hypothetical protein GE09DRAFT_1256385 [Coniochaeta sp. 2T2.1]|nr:hypothetical protein GE09DRAFT_1256385 [Coniochaeta sp. 2T2.1]
MSRQEDKPALGYYHFFIDFDGTITEKDTIDLLGKRAIGRPERNQGEAWENHTKWYYEQTERYDREHPVDLKSGQRHPRPPLTGNQDLMLRDKVIEHINGRERLEREGLDIVNGLKFFDGLTEDQLYEEARKLTLNRTIVVRKDFSRFIKALRVQKAGFTILSVNWSDMWIKGCLSPHYLQLDVISNRIEDGKVKGPGPKSLIGEHSDQPLLTGAHKLIAMESARQKLLQKEKAMRVVYIGDSKTDLQCMLASDLAVIMVDNDPHTNPNTLVKLVTLLGHQVRHVGDPRRPTDEKFVWARNFAEIMEAVPVAGRISDLVLEESVSGSPSHPPSTSPSTRPA